MTFPRILFEYFVAFTGGNHLYRQTLYYHGGEIGSFPVAAMRVSMSGGSNSVVNPHLKRETRRCSRLTISLAGRSLESTICFRPSNSVLKVWKNSSWERSLPAKN